MFVEVGCGFALELGVVFESVVAAVLVVVDLVVVVVMVFCLLLVLQPNLENLYLDQPMQYQ